MEHKLQILHVAQPIKQKRRYFRPEKEAIIREEVNKLLVVGHIRKVHYPSWLSNMVLVPKPFEKWHMCVDFRDLNKACPKDCYPLPHIDQLVNSTVGHQFISMMDVY